MAQMGGVVRSHAAHVQLDRPVRYWFARGGQGVVEEHRHACRSELTIRGMLTFRAGDADRPRGHALVFFRDADGSDQIWATYLVVAPIKMDLGKYIPAAFASQLAGQLAAAGPAAYPLPPVPEKFEAGLDALERLAELRSDDLLDGGTLRMSDPLYGLRPVAQIGTQGAGRGVG